MRRSSLDRVLAWVLPFFFLFFCIGKEGDSGSSAEKWIHLSSGLLDGPAWGSLTRSSKVRPRSSGSSFKYLIQVGFISHPPRSTGGGMGLGFRKRSLSWWSSWWWYSWVKSMVLALILGGVGLL